VRHHPKSDPQVMDGLLDGATALALRTETTALHASGGMAAGEVSHYALVQGGLYRIGK
jgi:hypothetical protein